MNDDLKAAKEANERAPTKTMKSLVERLRNQLALKDKQQKVIDMYGNESDFRPQLPYTGLLSEQNDFHIRLGFKLDYSALIQYTGLRLAE